jgi:hypothetical protein
VLDRKEIARRHDALDQQLDEALAPRDVCGS